MDSNHLRLKPTDLQSAPALQLRRTPNLVKNCQKLEDAMILMQANVQSVHDRNQNQADSIFHNFLVRAAGNRAYKNTTSCVISNELMFASQGYPTQLHLTCSLGAGSGNRTRISSLEGLHTSLCTMPATNSKPCDYILNLPKRKYFSQGHIRLSDSVDNIFHFQQEFHIIPTGL